ncbi:hypothetical protein FXO38_04655 [Capsicum annuum]|nr:hypothetical protein FXO38_04655 [Capsicum annuum]
MSRQENIINYNHIAKEAMILYLPFNLVYGSDQVNGSGPDQKHEQEDGMKFKVQKLPPSLNFLIFTAVVVGISFLDLLNIISTLNAHKIMTDPVWDVAFLQDAVNELRNQVRDLQWELGVVRSRMLHEIRRLRRALLLPVEDWPADNDDADNNNNN